ncbi:hypothetical protein LJC17_00205 [Acholeplasma sp. OttesenSCG-928-E16]|nr:hypothetical protein [Acholeplasma sp. OttesenSCG-928-E16]
MSYRINKNNIVLYDFSCNSKKEILTSETFFLVLERFIKYYKKKKNFGNLEDYFMPLEIIGAYLILTEGEHPITYNRLLTHYPNILIEFGEAFYDYWRKIQRYGVLSDDKDMISTSESFTSLILDLYRTVQEKLMQKRFSVYRQLPAGLNALISINHNDYSNSLNYPFTKGIPFVDRTLIRPPFLIQTKSNTRVDYFNETKTNFIDDIIIDPNLFYCYPIYVGRSKAYVYCHVDYLHHLISLSNLFEPITKTKYLNQKPDIICIFGVEDNKHDGMIFHDESNDTYIGIISYLDKNDYFGYMKKMLLTLYNLKTIDMDCLPIHGAMVSLLMEDNSTKNIVIIGDSGAGKSESLEALRSLGSNHIKEMSTIFDDMGTFFKVNESVFATGTEIGAFVRLDDLEEGYVYKEIDRGVFINPDKKNARIVLPVSDYDFINKFHHIDMVLYANNYEDNNKGVKFFESLDDAKEYFIKGKRLSKGTTSETGITTSFFANPFGPMQRELKTRKLIDTYFSLLKENSIPIGILYTKLALPNMESDGPLQAAKCLLDYLLKLKN